MDVEIKIDKTIKGPKVIIYTNEVTPEISDIASKLNAALIQYLLSGLLGFALAVSSAIFEFDNWSITKRTLVHFIVTSIAFFPVSILSHWVNTNIISIIIYFAIWFIIYLVIWLAQYLFWKNKTNILNSKICKK